MTFIGLAVWGLMPSSCIDSDQPQIQICGFFVFDNNNQSNNDKGI